MSNEPKRFGVLAYGQDNIVTANKNHLTLMGLRVFIEKELLSKLNSKEFVAVVITTEDQ